MAREPVLKEFGNFLRQLRGKKSLRRIQLEAAHMGISLPKGTLQTYEKGRVGSIGAARMNQLALVFRQEPVRLINEYVKDRFGVDLRGDPLFSEKDLYSDPLHAELHQHLQTILDSPFQGTTRAVTEIIRELREKVRLMESKQV